MIDYIIKKFGFFRNEDRCRGIFIGKAERRLSAARKLIITQKGTFPSMVYGWKRAKGTIMIDAKKETTPHMIIVGMSGFGKSTLLRSIILGIKKSGKAAVIFDAHNEHEAVVHACNGKVHNAKYSSINILSLDGANVGERISSLTRLLSSVYGLGQIQSIKLSECLRYVYRNAGAVGSHDISLQRNPTIKDLIRELGIFINNARGAGERNTLLHMRSKISMLDSPSLSGDNVEIEALKSGINSFSLAGLRSDEMRTVYITELLGRLYNSMHRMEKEEGVNLYLVVDEAQNLINGSDDDLVVKKLMEEGRKYGVGVIVVTHLSKNLPKSMIGNSSTFISFYPREPEEVSYISKIFGSFDYEKTHEITKALSQMKKYQAMCISTVFRSPLIISTPTPAEVNRNIAQSENVSYDNEVPIERETRKPTTKEALMKRLYFLGMKPGEAESAMARTPTINVNGKTLYMNEGNNKSTEHESSILKISELLSALGIDHKIENGAGVPDIAVFHNGKRIALEYETGKKNLEETINMIKKRIEKFDQVLVIVNESHSSRYRDAEGLKINGVSIIGINEISVILPEIIKRDQYKQE